MGLYIYLHLDSTPLCLYNYRVRQYNLPTNHYSDCTLYTVHPHRYTSTHTLTHIYDILT